MIPSLNTTILIVEDDPGIAQLEKQRLIEAGHEVLLAITADEALDCMHRHSVDLILLDYRLPGEENGLEFYARVKALGFDTPVILVTGFGSESAVIQALRLGVRDFIVKTIEYLEFLPDAVARVLKQVTMEHQLAESEARLGAVIGSAQDAVIVTEADRRVSLFNPAAERMFQCSAAEALGRPITDFIPDELQPTGTVASGEAAMSLPVGTQGVRAGGERFPLEATVSQGEANGRPFSTVVVRDVTQRVRADEALRESGQRFQALVEASAQAVWTMNAEGKVVEDSPSWRAFTGLTHDQVKGDGWVEAVHPDDRDDAYSSWRRVVETRSTLDTEFRIRHISGDWRWTAARAVPLHGADGAVKGWVGMTTDITERRRAEERIREQAMLLDLAHDGIMMEDMDGRIQFWNRGAERIHGWKADEILGRDAAPLLYPGQTDERQECLRRVLAEGQWSGELRQVTKSGKEIIVHCSFSLIRGQAERPASILVICTDVTAQRQVEEQFRQAQKMEVFGRLVAGIAHDFNNLLTVINGCSELALTRLANSDPARELVDEIGKAGERAAALTRQLLAFSRQQVLDPRVLNLNEVVQGISAMLRRLLGEDLEVTTALSPELALVKVDPGQIEQVLTNLAINARDAMPQYGRLTIETANVELDAMYARMHPEVVPGRYVQLSVSDTGRGMSEEVKRHIFEPFFTTKEIGKGTGLGLATVFGIVKQSGGHIGVYSEAGKGTAFKIYLPCIEEQSPQAVEPAPDSRAVARGDETILLVEDEPAVRALTLFALRSKGYTVLEAADGAQALQICQAYEGPIHLLMSDVVMPQLGGRELAQRVTALRPQIGVLFLSGYTPDAVVRHGVLEAEVAFLQKPFTVKSLVQKVRSVLDAASLPETDPPREQGQAIEAHR